MATATRPKIGPADHGRRMSLDRFMKAEFEEGHLYELARGVIVVTEVPGPSHGMIVRRIARLFDRYDENHPGVITYAAGGAECRLRLPGMKSDRHPDQAVYLDKQPPGENPWSRWVPHIVVEVLSKGSKKRDTVEKREEYLRVSVREYWILDPKTRRMTVLVRAGDTWEDSVVAPGHVYRTHILPGLEVRPDELFGSAK